MTATNGVSNGDSHPDAGQVATPQPEKGSWTIGLINSRYIRVVCLEQIIAHTHDYFWFQIKYMGVLKIVMGSGHLT